jgi:hypothetical protein
MSKAQTDIRTTSYDEVAARPFGYQGTIDDVLAQIRAEDDAQSQQPTARAELIRFLNVGGPSVGGPSVEMDESPRYGLDEPADEPGFYTLAYALKHFPHSFQPPSLTERLGSLTKSQQAVYIVARASFGVEESLAKAEAYPYPAVRS